jgi:hypothetical protein
MVDFLSILKREPMKVHSSKLQPLLDLMQLHLSRCELANLTFVPKMHFAAHLVCRTAGPDVELAGHPMHRCPPSSLPIPPSGSRHRSHSNHRSRSSHRTSTASTHHSNHHNHQATRPTHTHGINKLGHVADKHGQGCDESFCATTTPGSVIVEIHTRMRCGWMKV